MGNKNLDLLAQEVLSQLELKETELLAWGFVEVKYDIKDKVQEVLDNPPTDLIHKLWKEIQSEGIMMSDIIGNLKKRKLIFRERSGKGRSRYAETFRLMSLLKQRFDFGDWQTAPDLVSNIKPKLRYRRYPKRNQTWEMVKENLKEKGINSQFRLEVIHKLIDDGQLKLANFQTKTLEYLLQNVNSNKDQSTIIGAGTGSGKTLAFYLPAITEICAMLEKDDEFRTRILSIYPRIELLKDQLNEALEQIGKLNDLLSEKGLRTLSAGAYYGDTPYGAENIVNSEYYKWEEDEKAGGYICPYLFCPKCNSELVWLKEDHEREIENSTLEGYGEYERLHCVNLQCDYLLTQDNIMLTRERMKKTPPDILFTTTEMLNRNLFNNQYKHIFGLNDAGIPEFILLDEVHIYNGVTGAQVSYLLKRWRNLTKFYDNSSVQFVGLSATLTNPKLFFSNLTGVNEGYTKYITPLEEELAQEGMEYNLVVRGDPISKIALLSTSVQTTMLLGRMLDPLHKDVSQGAWGKKIFGFTDKLDVINRWYHIEQDAEEHQCLSQYRDQEEAIKKLGSKKEVKDMAKKGQIWNAAKVIDKKSLKNGFKVGITSSQSRGVDSEAKLVIATSTLEVGYNDSGIGAVVQHKSPHNLASFLQRKGRAGRLRGMRPWTVVITSAYGRDRWLYENPDYLFSPTLPELSLPTYNTYVQRIQAGFALMDWLTLKLNKLGYEDVNLWRILTPTNRNRYQNFKTDLIDILKEVIEDNDGLVNFIQSALQVNKTTLKRIMWAPPRSIMLNLIPNLIIKLKEDWSKKVVNGKIKTRSEIELSNYPLSNYITPNLFSSLKASEVEIGVPHLSRAEYMPLSQALFEFAPGNISKRYAKLNRKNNAHWIKILENSEGINLDESKVICNKEGIIKEDKKTLALYTPYKLQLEEIPKKINDRSRGELEWEVKMLPEGKEYTKENQGQKINLIEKSYLNDLIGSLEVFTSENNQWVCCYRYAKKVKTEMRYKNGKIVTEELKFKKGEQEVCLGFSKEIDAIALTCRIPDLKVLTGRDNWKQIISQLKTKYYLYSLQKDDYLKDKLSRFSIRWLWEIYTSSLIAVSVSKQISLKEARNYYSNNLIPISKRALEAIFQVPFREKEEERELYQELLEFLREDKIVEILSEKSKVLDGNLANQNEFWDWLQEKYKTTIASSFKKATNNLLPDLNTDELLVDIIDDIIWFSEPEAGGVGIISSVAAKINNSPGEFADLFLEAINYCPREELAMDLNSIMDKLDLGKLDGIFTEVREADTLKEQQKALKGLKHNFFELGISPTNDLIVTLKSKLLHRNSSKKTDDLIYTLNQKWRHEEKRLNCAFDYRIFAVVCLQLEGILEKKIEEILGEVSSSSLEEKQKFSLVESMLWSSCKDSCPECLEIYNPYSELLDSSRIILQNLIEVDYAEIDYFHPLCQDKLIKNLKEERKVRLIVDFFEIEKCRKEVLDLINLPIEIGFELFYPYIERVELTATKCYIDINIREVLHA